MRENNVEFWASLLNSIDEKIRVRASAYLSNVQRISDNAWVVQSVKTPKEYLVKLEGGRLTCTCPFFSKEGTCKHVAAVAAYELIKRDFPRLKKKIARVLGKTRS